jgi:ABC-type phosphate/phosphonate transport system substrate-binding protein
MYDVTVEARGRWHALARAAARQAGLRIDCIDHAAPRPLAELWARKDLALVFMCGYPVAALYPHVRPLAAPITVLAEHDRPNYRSVWLVRADSAHDTLASTFGHRIGWMAEHSHSAFNAPRHALLAHRTATRSKLYRESIGPLGHPRGALEALATARIDVTAVDAYWWWLLQKHDAPTASRFRAIGETAVAPMPPLVCAAGYPDAYAQRLLTALIALHEDDDVRPHFDALGIRRFAAVTRADYLPLGALDRAAHAAGYPLPE